VFGGVSVVPEEIDKSGLREKARKRLEGKGSDQERSAEDIFKLVEELSLHQEELNIQNEELLRIQAELELSKAKYFELYDLAPVGYITLSPGLMIKEANLSTSILLGTERKDLIGRAISTFVLPQSQELLYLHYRRLDQGMEKQVGTFLVRGGKGKELQVQFESNRFGEGSNTGFRTILTDVTEVKKVELALQESELRYRSLFRDNSAPMLLIDPLTGDIIDMNQTACEYYCYSHSDLAKMKIFDINPLSPEKVREEMSNAISGKKRRFDFQHRLANGEVHNVEVFSGPIYLNGRPVLYSIIHDVTDRKMLEETLRKRTSELARSNEELQQFAHIASHDLQEPLRMVVNFLTILEKNYADELDSSAQEYIRYAVDGGKRMRQLIDDLLRYSRVDMSGKVFAPVDMNGAVARTLDILGLLIEESETEVLVDPLPTVEGDESQIVQLLQNLISNAIKFRGPERPRIHISATIGPGEWMFAVKDNGIGIDMNNAGKIFIMFQRQHRKDEYPGSGIGLAIAKKIVERHGGRIWVESEEGKGATFFFTIPKAGRDMIGRSQTD
jgi:PAS domain S-box-containing protein